ncbi:MAG TPA: hypothetical protein VM865_10160, partial [Acidobacteriaceae bacterium]|nr:hypothetical protein [Acidobacteriaceae bacterium]
ILATEGTFRKGEPTPEILAAQATPLGRAYLDWSPMPILTVDRSPGAFEQVAAEHEQPASPGGVVVTLLDPRFMGVLPWLSRQPSTPLTGTILLDRQRQPVLQVMDGRAEPQR